MSDFWARRKAAVEAEAREDERLADEALRAEREAVLAERSDEEILAELDLPDPDSLQEGDDFKVFLTEAVPARIRTRALRRLWRVNPVLANVDGLVDYGEDFNDASFIVENMQTAYQVGKGMTKHVLEMARQAAEDDTEQGKEDEAPADEPKQEPPVLVAVRAPDHESQSITPEVQEEGAEIPAPPVPETQEQLEQSVRPQRRMRFSFDQEAS